ARPPWAGRYTGGAGLSLNRSYRSASTPLASSGLMIRRCGTAALERIERVLELGNERVELIDDCSHGFGAAQIHAGSLKQRHWMIDPARLEQGQVTHDRCRPVGIGSRRQSPHELRARRITRRVLVDVI